MSDVHTAGAPVKIGILGHVGNKNLGDEAIIAAVIENIRKRIPDAHIIGYTANPEDTKARHKIPAFPIRRLVLTKRNTKPNAFPVQGTVSGTDKKKEAYQYIKKWIKNVPWCYRFLTNLRILVIRLTGIPKELFFLRDCYRNIRGVQLLIVAGSQQLIDYIGTGPWEQPYNLFKWSILARIANAKVAFLSVGAGPIYTRLGRFFIRKALLLACYGSYRDETSRNWIAQLNLGGDIAICPDLAFSSLKHTSIGQTGWTKTTDLIVGINPVPFYNENYWVGGGDLAYKNYIEKLGLFGIWLIEKGYKVHLFPTQLNLDPRVISDIKQIMRQNMCSELDKHLVDKPIDNLEELLYAISCMEFVVASRYHGSVLAYALNKPVLGIAYQAKTADLMRLMQQEDYVLDLQNLELEEMKRKFQVLERSVKEVKDRIGRKTSACREMLANQYDQVIRLLY